jgi:hypothetical protein
METLKLALDEHAEQLREENEEKVWALFVVFKLLSCKSLCVIIIHFYKYLLLFLLIQRRRFERASFREQQESAYQVLFFRFRLFS